MPRAWGSPNAGALLPVGGCQIVDVCDHIRAVGQEHMQCTSSALALAASHSLRVCCSRSHAGEQHACHAHPGSLVQVALVLQQALHLPPVVRLLLAPLLCAQLLQAVLLTQSCSEPWDPHDERNSVVGPV